MSETIDKEESIEKSLEDASSKGLYRRAEMRPQIKLPPAAPKIAICIPMGDKDDPDLFVCPKCKHRHFGVVLCEKCGENHSALRKLRTAGLAPIEFQLDMMSMVPPLLCAVVVLIRKSVLSGQARNEMTYDAIKLGCKYIFYWDDDTMIPPKAIYDLHNMMERTPEAAIISGVYVTREDCPEPLIYKTHGQGAYWGFSTKPGILEEIFAAGAGCMMARVDALIEVKKLLGDEWWCDEHDRATLDEPAAGKITWGHDIRFCRRIHEAVATGRTALPWKVYVAGWILCYHFDVGEQKMYFLPADSPPMKGNANTQSYWDHVWGNDGVEGRFYKEIYEKIVTVVPQESNVVDVGCGVGVLMDMLVKKNRAYAYGYDLSPKAIEMVKSRWLDGEAQDVIDFKLNHFDPGKTILIATEILEHLDDDRLKNLLAESRKAELAIFSTPEGIREGTPEGEHVREFTKSSLRELLCNHFENVVIHRMKPQHFLAVCSGGKQDEYQEGSVLVSNELHDKLED